MKITKTKLRQIIKEEVASLTELNDSPMHDKPVYSYVEKFNHLLTAYDALNDALEVEKLSHLAEDPELEDLIAQLYSYMRAVEALADEERKFTSDS
jgi:hypothetical protein